MAESGNVENMATLAAKSCFTTGTEKVTTGETERKKSVSVKETSSGSGYGTYCGKIKLVKEDAEDTSLSLTGAEFELFYLLNDNVMQFGDTVKMTGDTITIEKVPFRTYYLKETKAPEGYVLPNEDIKIELNKGNIDASTHILEKIVENIKIKGHIEFTKVDDAGNLVEGAVFTLYDKDDNEVKTATSDSDGKVKFENVPYGTYTIEETKTPDGYEKADDIYATIGDEDNGKTVIPTKTKGGDEIIEVVNERKKGSIKLKKVDEGDKPLGGAEFGIYLSSDTELEKPVKTVISGSDGEVEFTDIPYGDYTIAEIAPPEGYLPSAEQITVKFGDFTDETDGKIDYTTDTDRIITNTKIKGNVLIIKKGEGDNLLSGAEFGLFRNADGSTPVSGFNDVTANDTGAIEFEEVPYGTYFIKEIAPPEGYLISDEQLPQEVTINVTNYNTPQKFTFENTLIRGDIELTKVDAYDKPLEGVVFALYDEDGTNPVKDNGGTAFTATSDSNGKATFTGIPYGDYQVKEIKTLEGYRLETEKVYNVSIVDNGVTVTKDTEDEDLKVTNIELGRITVEKFDKANDTRLLKGAEFEIRNESGVLVQTITTDEDGIAMTEKNLEYGSYTLVETKAPSGYRLDRTEHELIINGDNDGANIELTLEIPNTRRSSGGGPPPKDPEEPEDPKDPEEPKDPEDPEDPKDPEEPEEPRGEEPKDPEDPNGNVKEETPKDTPKEGKVDVPEESETKVKDPPKRGKVEIDRGGKWKYTPEPGFVGKDKFTITVTHPDGTLEDIIIEIDVKVPMGGIEVLPKTGEGENIGYYLLGLLFILGGLYAKRRKTA